MLIALVVEMLVVVEMCVVVAVTVTVTRLAACAGLPAPSVSMTFSGPLRMPLFWAVEGVRRVRRKKVGVRSVGGRCILLDVWRWGGRKGRSRESAHELDDGLGGSENDLMGAYVSVGTRGESTWLYHGKARL